MGGTFISAGGTVASNIAMWDGQTWSALGVGLDNAVDAIEVINSGVYVGGKFTNAWNAPGAGPVRVDRIAYWSPETGWCPAGPITGNGFVFALAASGNVLFAGGSFTNIGGIQANRVAMLRDGVWHALVSGEANGVDGTVYAILADADSIYVGGAFTNAGGILARGIAKWDGTGWSPLGTGMLPSGASVRALA